MSQGADEQLYSRSAIVDNLEVDYMEYYYEYCTSTTHWITVVLKYSSQTSTLDHTRSSTVHGRW